MSLNPQALTTVARLKTYMKKTDVADDTILEILVNFCTDFVESYCGRRFLQTDYSQELYDGTGRTTLLLKNYPVVTTGKTFQVDERASLLNENDWDTLDTESVLVENESGIVHHRTSKFRQAPQHYRVTYTAGYAFKNNAATFVTLESLGLGDLELAVWELTKKAFLSRKRTTDVASESLGDYSVTFRESAMLDPLVAEILRKYVRADAML